MERLSGLDAAFLYLETPSNLMHVSMLSVFDPASMAEPYSFERVRSLIEQRLRAIPLFRRRLVEVPFRLHHPIWVEDPDFDLDYHVRRAAIPSPGGMQELCELAGDFVSRPLDRARPLWEMVVVEGLEHDHIGLLAKIHHATIDGVGGAEVMVHLYDLEAQPAAPAVGAGPPEIPRVERVPSDLELVAYAARSIARQPGRLLGMAPSTARSVLNLVRRRRSGESGGMAAPFSAPRTSLNGSLTPHRSVATVHLSLEDVKAVKRSFGATVNDVVLTLCSGALRRYFSGNDELPEEPLVAVVPISVRSDGKSGPGANQVSAMFVNLASDIEDPGDRLLAVAQSTRGAKEDHNAIGARMLQDWAEFAAPAVFSRAAQLYSRMRLADRHRPIHNVVISNVPGPPFPLYLAGARMVMMCPFGPVMEGAGLNITVISYLDGIDVGLIACRELVPDLWRLARDFETSMEELKAAAKAV
ncbi:MAG: WS/DGAT/MGAT family O-acyltransferase [Acidimicrobiales bacterium]